MQTIAISIATVALLLLFAIACAYARLPTLSIIQSVTYLILFDQYRSLYLINDYNICPKYRLTIDGSKRSRKMAAPL